MTVPGSPLLLRTPRDALVPLSAVVVAVVTLVLGGSLIGRLELVGLAVAGVFAVVVSFRWPLLPLFAFAALIPLEEVGRLGDLGTPSRVAAIVFVIAYALPRLGRLPIAAIPLAGWLFVGWAGLSMAWAIEPEATLLHLPTLLQLFVAGLLIACVVARKPEIVSPLLWTYSLSAAVTSSIALQSYITGGVTIGQRTAAFAAQDEAQFAAVLLPAIVFLVYQIGRGRLLALAIPAALVVTLGIVVSGTRAVWLSAIVVSLAFVMPRLRPSRAIVTGFAAAVLVLVALQLPGAQGLVSERAGDALATGGAGRTDIWTVAYQIFASSPLGGVGFANFPIAYTPQVVQSAGVTQYTASGFAPHSILFGTLGELGIVGLVLLLVFLGPLLLRTGAGEHGPIVQALLISLMLDALFIDLLANRKQVWLIIGMAAGLAYIARHGSPRSGDHDRPSGRADSPQRHGRPRRAGGSP